MYCVSNQKIASNKLELIFGEVKLFFVEKCDKNMINLREMQQEGRKLREYLLADVQHIFRYEVFFIFIAF